MSLKASVHRLTNSARAEPDSEKLHLDQERFEVVGRDHVVVALRRDQHLGQVRAVEPHEQARRLGVALRDRPLLVGHGLGPEILHQEKARLQVLPMDLRRAEAQGAQALVHGREGVNRLGELGHGGVGLAPPHGRARRARGRNHQENGLAVGLHEALVGADHRGVAGHRHAGRVRPAAPLHKAPEGLEPQEPGPEAAGSRENGHAALAPAAGGEIQGDVEALLRQGVLGPLRPLHQGDGVLRRLVPAQLHQLASAGEPVEIRVHDGAARAVIDLHQGEGGARHLEARVACQDPHEGAGQGGLARPETPRQGEEVAGFQLLGQDAGEILRRRMVGERHDPGGLRCGVLGHEGQSIHHRLILFGCDRG
jgi:hypothetical protein